MLDFTFLTKEQVFGNNQLDILKKYGTRCAITDFSILLGARGVGGFHTIDGLSRKNRTNWWWTKTPFGDEILIVGNNGSWTSRPAAMFGCCGRPALSYSSISSIASNKVRGLKGILEVEYGEYPQMVVSEEFSRILENAFANMSYSNSGMKITGKSYTTDSTSYQDGDNPFQSRTHIEYEYNGRKYIRFVGDSNCSGEVLSDGRIIQDGSPYWVEVEPIKWMIDEKTGIAISKKLLFSGVKFAGDKDHYNGDFDNTYIKKFMDEYFAKEIIPNEKLKQENQQETEEKRRGIKVKDVNVAKVEEILTKNEFDLEKEAKKIDTSREKTSETLQFTFLTKEQVLGSEKLEIFKKYDTGCETTDYCLGICYYVGEHCWWTKSIVFLPGQNEIFSIHSENTYSYAFQDSPAFTSRPAIAYSKLKDKSRLIADYDDGTLKAEYGEYPQTIVPLETQEKLNKLLEEKKMKKTGKKYTHVSFKKEIVNSYDKNQDKYEEIIRKFPEYEYQGKKYILFSQFQQLAIIKGIDYECGDNIWMEVEPVYWLVDVKNDVALSEKALFSGVCFKKESYFSNPYDGNFENTNIKKYMDQYFSKEIEASKLIAKKEVEGKRKGIKIKNINLEKIEEIVPDTNMELKENFKEKEKVKKKNKK